MAPAVYRGFFKVKIGDLTSWERYAVGSYCAVAIIVFVMIVVIVAEYVTTNN